MLVDPVIGGVLPLTGGVIGVAAGAGVVSGVMAPPEAAGAVVLDIEPLDIPVDDVSLDIPEPPLDMPLIIEARAFGDAFMYESICE